MLCLLTTWVVGCFLIASDLSNMLCLSTTWVVGCFLIACSTNACPVYILVVALWDVASSYLCCAGDKAVDPATLESLKNLTAGLFESMRFKPVGPVSIRQATKEFSMTPTEDCPSGLRLRKGDSVIVYIEGVCRICSCPCHPLLKQQHFAPDMMYQMTC